MPIIVHSHRKSKQHTRIILLYFVLTINSTVLNFVMKFYSLPNHKLNRCAKKYITQLPYSQSLTIKIKTLSLPYIQLISTLNTSFITMYIQLNFDTSNIDISNTKDMSELEVPTTFSLCIWTSVYWTLRYLEVSSWLHQVCDNEVQLYLFSSFRNIWAKNYKGITLYCAFKYSSWWQDFL